MLNKAQCMQLVVNDYLAKNTYNQVLLLNTNMCISCFNFQFATMAHMVPDVVKPVAFTVLDLATHVILLMGHVMRAVRQDIGRHSAMKVKAYI